MNVNTVKSAKAKVGDILKLVIDGKQALASPITKVTKTQFTVIVDGGNIRYNRKTGKEIGGDTTCKLHSIVRFS